MTSITPSVVHVVMMVAGELSSLLVETLLFCLNALFVVEISWGVNLRLHWGDGVTFGRDIVFC